MAANTNAPVKPAVLKKVVCRRKLVLAVLSLLAEVVVCVSQVVLGVWVHITVENVNAGAFWAPILLVVGALVSLEGILFSYGRQKVLGMGVMMQVIGIFMAVIGAVLDGVVASMINNVDFSLCAYSSAGMANCSSELSCKAVQLSFPKSCYCCYLTKERDSPCYFRAVSLFQAPSLYAGVDSCSHVSGEFLTLLWTSAALCGGCCIFGIIAASTTYSYRKVKKPQRHNITITTMVTSPMLPQRRLHDGSVAASSISSGSTPALDIPVPAPRNSLIRSTSNSPENAAPSISTPERNSTPERTSTTERTSTRKKRRAPDIPTMQSSSAESSPTRSAAVVVRPKSNSANISMQSSDENSRLSSSSLAPPAERSGSSSEVRPKTNPSPSRSVRSITVAPAPVEVRPRSASNTSSPPPAQESEEHSERQRPSSHQEASDCERRRLTPHPKNSPSRSPARVCPSSSGSQDESQDLSLRGAAALPPSGRRASPRRDFNKGEVKKRKSHKGPAPLPPPLQEQFQHRALPPVETLDTIPQSPPPAFVANRPPSPPPSPPPAFTSSPSMQYNPHHPHQPVTNIHVTLTTSPMNGGVQMPGGIQMPMAMAPQGYMYHSQPSAPYL